VIESRWNRVLLAVALLVASCGMLDGTGSVDRLPHPRGLAALVDLTPLTTDAGRMGAVALMVVLLGVFVSGRSTQLVGWAVVLLAWCEHDVESSVHQLATDHGQGSQEPFTTLIAWLIGVAIAPRLGKDRERLGSALACGVVASGYTMAGLSKLWHSGLGWVDGRAMALMMYERIPGAWPPFAELRGFVAGHVTLAGLSMAVALVVELAGFLWLFRPARRPMMVAAVVMHVAIGIFLGYFHPDWAMTAIAWGVAAGGRPKAAETPLVESVVSRTA
jgi:hypothetical protein